MKKPRLLTEAKFYICFFISEIKIRFYKPRSVYLPEAKRSIIYLFLMSPSGYSSLPVPVLPRKETKSGQLLARNLHGLTAPEVYHNQCCHRHRGLLPRVFTLSSLRTSRYKVVYFSVALSVIHVLQRISPPVRWQVTLYCADFPPSLRKAIERTESSCKGTLNCLNLRYERRP